MEEEPQSPLTQIFLMDWQWRIKSGIKGVGNVSVILLSSRNNYPINLLATQEGTTLKK